MIKYLSAITFCVFQVAILQLTEADFKAVFATPIPTNNSPFSASLGDINQDGTDDYIGTTRDLSNRSPNPPRLIAFYSTNGLSGSIGSQGNVFLDLDDHDIQFEDPLGRSMSLIGDFDRNGSPEILLGAPGFDTSTSNSGEIFIVSLMRRTGRAGYRFTQRSSLKIASNVNGLGQLQAGDQFGYSANPIGDVDGDGISDIAVGAPGSDNGGSSTGAVHILLLNEDATVKRQIVIDSSSLPIREGDRFGSSVEGIGDFNNDGIYDLAVGAPFEDTGSLDRGAVCSISNLPKI